MEENHVSNGGHTDEHLDYNPPLQKSIEDFIIKDAEDESLLKYKKTLLGEAIAQKIVIDENNPNLVIPKNLILIVEGRHEKVLDLTGDLKEIHKKPIVIKEGTPYAIKINFFVQRDMVYGLKYIQTFFRKGIKIDKTVHMIGCYGPSKELKSFTTPVEEAPSGLVARGTYHVKSCFMDDDKKEHLKWEWVIEIKKDWED